MYAVIAIIFIELSLFASGNLYENTAYITVLDSSNFSSFVTSQPTLVQFFLSNCGGCQQYVPTFINLSKSVAIWQWAFKIAVIDCADPATLSLLKNLDILFFPSLRFFYGDKNYPFAKHLNASSFREEIVTKLLESDTINNFHPFNENKKIDSDFFTIHSNDKKRNAMLILDVQPRITKKLIAVANTTIPDNKFSLTEMNVIPIFTSVDEETVREYLTIKYMKNPADRELSPKAYTSQRFVNKPFNLPHLLPVYAADILASLKILLFQDVALKQTIVGEDLSALKEFLNVVTKYLSLGVKYNKALSFLKVKVDASSSLTSDEWTHLLNNSDFPKTELEFLACRGSQSQYRGYPCGLWIMFHAMTVQRFLIENSPDPNSSIAHALNRFVPRFFSCGYCAFHFAALSSNVRRPGEPIFPVRGETPPFILVAPDPSTLPAAPTNPHEEMLWLNAAHNAVNKRLSKAAGEDPVAPKAVFPSPRQCSLCWSVNAAEKMKVDRFSALPDMQDELTAFLIHQYQTSSWKWTGLSVSYKNMSNFSPNVYHLTTFTTGDLVQVSAISVGCTVLLATFAYCLFCRRKRFRSVQTRV